MALSRIKFIPPTLQNTLFHMLVPHVFVFFLCINIHKWTALCTQLHTQQRKVMVWLLWHMFTYVKTLPGCDSCASSEGRYVLNHSSLININDSGL